MRKKFGRQIGRMAKMTLGVCLATSMVVGSVGSGAVPYMGMVEDVYADTTEDFPQELSLQNDSLSTATDKIGEVKISKIGYQMAELWYDDVFVVKKNDKWGAVDFDGKIVVPIEYDDYFWANSEKTEVSFRADESRTIGSQTLTYQNYTVYRYSGEKVLSYTNKSHPFWGSIEYYAYGDGILGNSEFLFGRGDLFSKNRVIDTSTGEVIYSPEKQWMRRDAVCFVGHDNISHDVCAASDKEYYRFQNGEVVKYDFPRTISQSYNYGFIADDVIYSPESNGIYYVATGEEFSFPDNCDKETLSFGRDGYYALMDNDTQSYNIYHKGEVVSETNLTWISFKNCSKCIVGGNDTTAYVLDYQGKKIYCS